MRPWGIAGFVLFFGACTPKNSFVVVQEANPNPFQARGCKLTIDAVVFDKLVYAGKPESDRLAAMSPEQQATFQDDKRAFSFALKQQIVSTRATLISDGLPAGANAFLMRPALLKYSPGGDAELLVDVTDPSGQVIDEVRVTSKVLNLREAATPLGRAVDRYLKSRFTCAR